MALGRTAEPLVVYLLFQILYATFALPVFPMVGDAADYASLIAHGEFGYRTVHIGFYLAYHPFHLLNQEVLGIDPAYFMNLLTSVFGALGVAAVYFVARELVGRTSAGMEHAPACAATIYGLSGIVWYHAEFAEVQSLMLFLAYGAFLLFLHAHHALAGAVLGAGALVSQAIAPVGAWFVAVAVLRHMALRSLLSFGASFAGVLLLGVLPVYEDYLWGQRGTLSVVDYYDPAGVMRALLSFVYTILESFWMVLPLAIIAVGEVRKQRLLIWVTLAALPPMLYVGQRLGHTDYGIVWLPMMAIVATWLGVGLCVAMGKISSRLRLPFVLGVACLMLATTLYTYILPKQRAWVRADSCLEEVHEIVGEAHLLADPYVGMAYGHRFWSQWADVWEAPWSMVPQSREAIEEMAGGEVYVVDYTPPSHFLRSALFSNPIMERLIGEPQRAAYIEEFPAVSSSVRSLAPARRLDLVLECDRMRLWSLR